MPAGETACVEETSFMTANHMDLLNDWRDAVVREGRLEYTAADGRVYQMSLTETCLDCHESRDAFCTRGHDYANVTPTEVGPQDVDPLVAENGSTETTLGQPFTIAWDDAATAVVDWTTLDHERVTQCTRVFLRLPSGLPVTLKAVGEEPANPYDVMTWYTHANGGAGQYSIGVEEVASGPCKNTASLSGATMIVTGPITPRPQVRVSGSKS